MSLENCVSHSIRRKLKSKHNVNIEEIEECFCNREKGFLIDTREEHETNPPTNWFIAETNYGRKLKVIFIPSDPMALKTAYEPNELEIMIYEKYA